MLACFVPVCKTADDEVEAVHEGKTKSAASRHGFRLFTFQLKQMASRLTSGALYKPCSRPPSTTTSSNDIQSDNAAMVNPTSNEMVQSPQFSLKSYQVNGRSTPTRQGSISDNHKIVAAKNVVRSLQKNFIGAVDVREGGCKDPRSSPEMGKGADCEWVAQVEPGVYITFYTSPDGFNDLRRIKFSRAMFGKQQAESWWVDNSRMVRELYNVRPPSSTNNTEDDRFSSGYATPDAFSKSPSSFARCDYQLTRRKSSADSRFKDDSRVSDSQKSEDGFNNSWVEQDEEGVYLTILTFPGGVKQLKRIRFSRDKFSENEAAAWWEHNRQRIYAQYINSSTGLQGK